MRETKQVVYVNEGIGGLFMSCESGTVLGIILPDFTQDAEFKDIP